MLSVIVCILSLVVLASVGYSYINSLRVRKLEKEIAKIIITLKLLSETKSKPRTTRKLKV